MSIKLVYVQQQQQFFHISSFVITVSKLKIFVDEGETSASNNRLAIHSASPDKEGRQRKRNTFKDFINF